MLQNSNIVGVTALPSTTVAAAIAASSVQPKLVVIRRRPNQGFGFTLRHFIAYPPEDDAASWPQEATNVVGNRNSSGSGNNIGGGGGGGMEPTSPTSLPPYQVKAMETIFIKEVQANGPANYANLQTGDRVLMVNNTPIAGIAYSTIVSMIKQTPAVLTLHVVPKECDVLQMHYTSIAHTPESNRLTMSTQGSPALLSNGAKSTFPQQQLISYPAVANSSSSPSTSISPAPPLSSLHAGSRSSSIASNASGTGNNSHYHQFHQQQQQQLHPQRHPALAGGSSSIDFGDMAHGLRQHQQHQQHQLYQHQQQKQQHHYQQQQHHHQQQQQQQQLMSSSFMRANQPPNLSVLPSTTPTTPTTRQPKSATALSQALYAVNANGGGVGGVGGGSGENSDLMIRLRESIKQKEEFLKSPLPSGVLSASAASASNGNALQSSPQQQSVQHFFPSHTPSGAPGGGGGAAVTRGRQQVLIKQQQQQQQQQQVVLGYDMYNSYTGSKMASRSLGAVPAQQRQMVVSVASSSGKYAKELDYFETLQETGVTNKVFESKLVSHMSKGFDPFKPLSINTNAAAESSSASVALAKKQSVLYESLQQHPLHQMQAKYQQSSSSSSCSAVDGQTTSRMELHKATLANATIESIPSKLSNVPEHSQAASSSSQTVATLADIAESSAAAIVDAASVSVSNVVRRYKPLTSSSFDEGKPVRRISYLRATNNEAEYHGDGPAADGATATSAAAAAVVAAAAAAAAAAAVVEPHKTKVLVEEHPDPTYDVVAGGAGHEFIETPNGLEDVRLSTVHGSRRASMNSEMRSSIHIDAELNGKYVPNELEAFETEIEIKSSCINGKRMSEYRSWRQVKLEIKGDMLRIYSGRHAKSEQNVIELDIRNFKFFDESQDKKKYLIRMQSKPSTSTAHLATLGNELNLDDAHDKLTSSGSSSAAEPQTPATTAPSCGPYTEILFKTKSSNEMKRLFGLLQWKDSLNYDDNEQPAAGKQLAEPQKTAATSSYLDDVAGAADSSPLSSHSGSGAGPLEAPAAASLAAAAAATTGDSISPVMKLRKPSSHKHIPDKDLGSPKSKNWKDLLFRRGGGSGGSGSGVAHGDLASPSGCSNKTGGSIGLPLRACPMSKNNAYVPHLVEVCTNIVETKGLSVVGIYRIPGNKAAISELSELVNTKEFQFESCATDVRWEDVNVVSSLLKLFIRSLPDALMPASFYINFIEADKKTGMERIMLLKEIVESLPRHPYETMKHLIRHLCRVSDNCEANRMEPKNLAIIFGPSIIRTPNDTLETAVKDMKHQCRIVELLVTQYEYFFEGGSLPELADLSGGAAAPSPAQPQQAQEDQTSMLLHNLSKIERITERETRSSRFIPQLRRRTHGKRSAVSSDTYSGESVLSLDYAKVSASSTTSTSSSSTLHSSKISTTSKLLSSAMGSSSHSATATSSTTSKGASTSTKKRTTGGFLSSSSSRSAQNRKASLDEKDSGSVDSATSIGKHEQQRSSVDISILLTDDDSSSRLSDTGSMSLTTITDTLDSKLRNLRSGSESNDENGSPEFPKNRRHTLGQPLHLHSENIPYADESPERLFHNFCPLDAPHSLLLSRSCTATNSLGEPKEDKHHNQQQLQLMMKPTVAPLPASLLKAAHKLQHSATAPIHQGSSTAPASGAATPTAGTGSSSASTPLAGTPSSQIGGIVASMQRNSYGSKNLRFSSSLAYERGAVGVGAGAGSEDDSEGSTTSDPKEKLLMAAPSPSFFLERYNKKRRDHRLFRSASFNCRNYSTRHMSSSNSSAAAAAAANACCSPTSSSSSSWAHAAAALTKDEKTDMNLTKKRQIQNKQNRSIKRRHTVGGAHDYAANTGAGGGGGGGVAATSISAGHDLTAINYNHHNRHHQQQLLKLGGAGAGGANGAAAAETTTTTTTTTTVLRRLGAPAASASASVSANVSGASSVVTETNVALPVAGTSSTSNNNNSPLSDGSIGNSSGNVGGGAAGGAGAGSNSNSSSSSSVGGVGATGGDQVLEVGIRIKNINRARY